MIKFLSPVLFITILASNNAATGCSDLSFPNSCWGFTCCRSDLECCGWKKCCDKAGNLQNEVELKGPLLKGQKKTEKVSIPDDSHPQPLTPLRH